MFLFLLKDNCWGVSKGTAELKNGKVFFLLVHTARGQDIRVCVNGLNQSTTT